MSLDGNDILLVVAKSTSSSITSPSSSITIYYKPIPLSDTPEVEEEISHRQKDLLLGPFHPSLGPLPPEAIISRQIHSSILQNLLDKFVDIASDFLEPPESTEIPDFEERIAAFRTRWSYILHNVYFPTRQFWLDRIYYTLEDEKIEPFHMYLWYHQRVRFPVTKNALQEWDENAMYAKIMIILATGYSNWTEYSQKWVIDMEYIEDVAAFDKKRSKASIRERNLRPIIYDKPKPKLLSVIPRNDSKQQARYIAYGAWKPYIHYAVPLIPMCTQDTSIHSSLIPSARKDVVCKLNEVLNTTTSSESLPSSVITSSTSSSRDQSSESATSSPTTFTQSSPSSKLKITTNTILIEDKMKEINLLDSVDENENDGLLEGENNLQEALLPRNIVARSETY